MVSMSIGEATMVSMSGRSMTVYLPIELRERMRQFPTLQWSRIAQTAFERAMDARIHMEQSIIEVSTDKGPMMLYNEGRDIVFTTPDGETLRVHSREGQRIASTVTRADSRPKVGSSVATTTTTDD